MIEGTAKAEEMAQRYYGPIARDGQVIIEQFDDRELETILRFLRAALDLQRRHLDRLKGGEKV